MTGFGEAHRQQGGLAVAVEGRAINRRFFKLSVRASEGYAALEPQIEAAVRKTIRRGTIQVNLRVERAASPEDFKINVEVLNGYRRQLESISGQWKLSGNVPLEALLLLPGVVDDQCSGAGDVAAEWPLISQTLEAAMENLTRMRTEEGRAMAVDLKANCRNVAAGLEQIERRAPRVIEDYRNRLEDRLKRTLAEFQIVLDPADVIKEVGLFAERGDISEEIVRLKSHLEQFDRIMDSPESSGRKLEFLTQEMFREANTIGSKANDIEITQAMIEIKTAIERMREMIQNIE